MLAFRIALRYLFSRKSHHAVNIISYLSMGGVALATAAMVIVLSVFNGFQDFTEQRLSAITPDLQIESASGKSISEADSLTAQLRLMPEIEDARCVVQEKALAVCGDRQMAVTLRGEENVNGHLPSIAPYIIDGTDELEADLELTNGFISRAISSIGVINVLRPSAYYNEWVKIYEPKRLGRINPSNPMAAFMADSVAITGVFRTDNNDYDTDRLIVPIEVARRVLLYDTEATFVEVDVRNDVDVASFKTSLEKLLGSDYIVKDRGEQNQQTFRMINIEKWITLLMLAFILVIASFNILSTLSMLIIEKRDNIKILSSLGASPSMAGRIFARLSFLISVIGGIIGVGLGVVLSLAQQYGGFIKFNTSDLSRMAIESYPVRVNPLDLLIVFGVTAAVGLLTALIVRFSLRIKQ